MSKASETHTYAHGYQIHINPAGIATSPDFGELGHIDDVRRDGLVWLELVQVILDQMPLTGYQD